MNEKFNEVKSFFARGYSEESDENTTINFDLEMMGDDADYFMLEYSRKFAVNLDGFKFSDFFHDELGVKYLYYKFFKPEFLTNKKPLTLGHLSEVAVRGTWFDPY
jgi:hypothetical protein